MAAIMITMLNHIHWLGHFSVLITGAHNIYINPWRIARTDPPADLILISDDHYERCSPADIRKLCRTHTRLIGSEAATREIECDVLRPWQSAVYGRARINAVPTFAPVAAVSSSSYAAASTQAIARPAIGFVVSMDMYDVYYAGPTAYAPDIARVQPDVALLPLSTDTMTAAEAAQAVAALRPRYAIPFNWSRDNRAEATAFQRAVEAHNLARVRVAVLEPAL